MHIASQQHTTASFLDLISSAAALLELQHRRVSYSVMPVHQVLLAMSPVDVDRMNGGWFLQIERQVSY